MFHLNPRAWAKQFMGTTDEGIPGMGTTDEGNFRSSKLRRCGRVAIWS